MSAVSRFLSGFGFKPAGLWAIARLVVVAVFVYLVAQQWHAYYGFTSFLQIDARMAQTAIPAANSDRIFHHSYVGSYDGGYYAQIATNPGLSDAALKPAVDDLGYRARRILLPAIAWVLGGGDGVEAMRAYAWLNVALWFGLAALLWRVFPPGEWRGTVAWAGVMFGAGVMFSVRLALTDLATLLLLASAVLLVERGRAMIGATLMGVAGLTRETAVLAAAALLPGIGRRTSEDGRQTSDVRGQTPESGYQMSDVGRQSSVIRFLARALIVALPLGLWLLYLHEVVGGSSTGTRNLDWPFLGWAGRWVELWNGPETLGNPTLLWESTLEHVALTVQLIYLVWRRRPECPWWRIGAAYAVLCVCLGGAVWGGFPNATSRVLLPLTLAFNVRAVRDRARWGWFLFGNLSVVAGFHAVQFPIDTLHDLPAGSSWSSRHVLRTDERWSTAEWNSKHRWAWCGGEGGLTLRTWPRRERAVVEIELRGVTPRTIEVRHAGTVVWRGPVGDRPQWITLPELPFTAGRLDLELRSDTASTAEGADNTARNISFACFGARIAD